MNFHVGARVEDEYIFLPKIVPRTLRSSSGFSGAARGGLVVIERAREILSALNGRAHARRAAGEWNADRSAAAARLFHASDPTRRSSRRPAARAPSRRARRRTDEPVER